MLILTISLLLCACAKVETDLVGESSADEWSYLWYQNEPFIFKYIRTNTSDTTPLYAVWETPNKVLLTNATGNDDYTSRTFNGTEYGELDIKKLTPSLYGIYICTVYELSSHKQVDRKLFGINYRDVKQDSKYEKYKDHLAIAGISTGVFLIPLLAACVTYQFRFEARHGYKQRNRKTKYALNEHEMVTPSSAQAHDNPNFSTPM